MERDGRINPVLRGSERRQRRFTREHLQNLFDVITKERLSSCGNSRLKDDVRQKQIQEIEQDRMIFQIILGDEVDLNTFTNRLSEKNVIRLLRFAMENFSPSEKSFGQIITLIDKKNYDFE